MLLIEVIGTLDALSPILVHISSLNWSIDIDGLSLLELKFHHLFPLQISQLIQLVLPQFSFLKLLFLRYVHFLDLC